MKKEFEQILDVVPVKAEEKVRIKADRQKREDEARAFAMAADRVLANKSIKDLAAEYHLSKDRVKQHLDVAYSKGFYERFEAAILEKLVPPALAVYEAHLHRGNLEAARDLLFGMGILQKNPSRNPTDSSIETIEAYRISRKAQEG